MLYTKTKPCNNCPFRTDVAPYIHAERAREILYSNGTFTCHKTAKCYDDGEPTRSKKEAHCAGMLIILEKENAPNQMMRIAERIGLYDRTKLKMNSPVYESRKAAVAAHRKNKW